MFFRYTLSLPPHADLPCTHLPVPLPRSQGGLQPRASGHGLGLAKSNACMADVKSRVAPSPLALGRRLCRLHPPPQSSLRMQEWQGVTETQVRCRHIKEGEQAAGVLLWTAGAPALHGVHFCVVGVGLLALKHITWIVPNMGINRVAHITLAGQMCMTCIHRQCQRTICALSVKAAGAAHVQHAADTRSMQLISSTCPCQHAPMLAAAAVQERTWPLFGTGPAASNPSWHEGIGPSLPLPGRQGYAPAGRKQQPESYMHVCM